MTAIELATRRVLHRHPYTAAWLMLMSLVMLLVVVL